MNVFCHYHMELGSELTWRGNIQPCFLQSPGNMFLSLLEVDRAESRGSGFNYWLSTCYGTLRSATYVQTRRKIINWATSTKLAYWNHETLNIQKAHNKESLILYTFVATYKYHTNRFKPIKTKQINIIFMIKRKQKIKKKKKQNTFWWHNRKACKASAWNQRGYEDDKNWSKPWSSAYTQQTST